MLSLKKISFHLFALGMLVITVIPFALTIIISLSPLDLIAHGEVDISKFSLDSYVYILTKFPFDSWMINSVIVAFFVTVLNLVINSMLGYSMARHKGMGWLLFVIIACMMIPSQVLMAPTYMLLAEMGLINSYLGLILPFIFNLFFAFLMKQYYESMPFELEESAYMDGLSEMKTFWLIIFPIAKIPLISQAILLFTANWNAYLWPSIIGSSSDMYTLPVGLNSFHGQHEQFWNQIMAGVVLLTIPTIIIFLIFQKYFTKGIATSGLK
ncbi:carbohydrate ABC transporter permease [Psychromonas ossibalaenae]|uniref:carbohydrate ABC transporter permease n=1 Tax=Psychromonas ossibalaenae TaxID=444922 RepID=UPI000374A94B|nr:carbohydrate ABC transporter permease [Psychromonas ossibalaenae]